MTQHCFYIIEGLGEAYRARGRLDRVKEGICGDTGLRELRGLLELIVRDDADRVSVHGQVHDDHQGCGEE